MRRPMKYSCVRVGPVRAGARCPLDLTATIERCINSRDFAQNLCRDTTSMTLANVRGICIRPFFRDHPSISGKVSGLDDAQRS